MRGKNHKRHLPWITGLICLGTAGWIIVSRPPDGPVIEAVVVVLAGLAFWLVLSAVINKKAAGLMATGLVIGLLLNRTGVLDPLTGMLLVAVLIGLALI